MKKRQGENAFERRASWGLSLAFLAFLSLLLADGGLLLSQSPPSQSQPEVAPPFPALDRSLSGEQGKSPAASAGAASPGEEGRNAFNPKELEGADSKIAELAAHRLLGAIARKDPRSETSRIELLNYVLEKLEPSRLKAEGRALTAERIVDAMATWIASSGPPFPNVSEVILPLLGLGPSELRVAVVRALVALVRHEGEGLHGSSIFQSLISSLQALRPSSETFVEDASRVLWEADGKTLLGTLVGIVSARGGMPEGSPYLAELRQRTALDFPTGEGWQKWWGESRDLPLDKILADCQRRSREEYASNWRQMIRRFRETGDAERLLLAIQDTLESMYSFELRMAAVSSLGDFAEWVIDHPLAERSAQEGPEKDPKDRLLSRGLEVLLSLFNRKDSYVERAEVLRAALGSLTRYHSLLERHPALHSEVSGIVSARLHALSLKGAETRREELLEAIRVVGALRVVDASRFVEALIQEALQEARSSTVEDLDLLSAAVSTLGRLVEKKGIGRETSRLLMAHFKKGREGAEKTVRELRRACVSALSVGSEDEEVRADLRAFFRETLLGADRDLRIPAILGLGTLARQKDGAALDTLLEVLGKQGQFEPQEVIATVDSISYVGGEAALPSFLRYLSVTQEKAIQDHLMKKITALVEAGGLPTLAWTLEKLERLALEEEGSSYLELWVSLGSQPPIRDLVSTGKVEIGPDRNLEFLWKAGMSLARGHDLLGKEEGVTALVGRLAELIHKNAVIKEKFPQRVADLADFKVTLAQRLVIKGKLERMEGIDPLVLVKDFEALLACERGLTGRWRNLRWIQAQLSQPSPSEHLSRVRDTWHTFLSSEQNSAQWEGFPPGFRERHLVSLEALKEKAPPIPPPVEPSSNRRL